MRGGPSHWMFDAAADIYDRYVGRYSRELARALIGAANVKPNDRALDVGCGPGALTGELVALLGAGHVSAVDPSRSFVDACRARYPGVGVELAAAEALPFKDGSVDVAIAQLVVNFMSNAHAGVGEMRRVTRVGGTVAMATWDYASGMTLLRRFWDAAIAVDPEADVLDERHMRYCTQQELERLWNEVGLTSVSVGAVDTTAAYTDFEDLWSPLESGVGPAGAFVASATTDQRLALKNEFQTRLGVGDEPFELSARAWIVTGRVA